MPYTEESLLMGKDAPADMTTQLCFFPPNGPFPPGNQHEVKGTIGHPGDQDWIAVELSEGYEYTITVSGRSDDGGTAGYTPDDTQALSDSVVVLLDEKGVEATDEVDDIRDENTGLITNYHPELKFTPQDGTGTRKYFISVKGYTDNPGEVNTGGYTVSIKQKKVDPVKEGEGTAKINKLFGTDRADKLVGKDEDDTLKGMAGDDELQGGDGNDLLIGGEGGDTLRGGGGEDTISYEYSAAGVTIDLGGRTAAGGEAEGDDLGSDIENVRGSNHDDRLTGSRVDNKLWGMDGADILRGGDNDDTLDGGKGDDTLFGEDEDDVLKGGPGMDTLHGGAGSDTASYAGSMMGVTVRLHAAQAMGGDAEGDQWGEMEEVEYVMKDNDGREMVKTEEVPDIEHLTGSSMNDILAGDSRDNTIKGGGGDDRIYGGPNGGDDTLHGERGKDHIFGGLGDDTLDGGPGDDHLWGNGGKNTFYGGAGSDVIHANPEDNLINGWVKEPPLNNTNTDPDQTESSEGYNDPKASDTVSFAHLDEEYLDDRGVAVNLGGTGGGFDFYTGASPALTNAAAIMHIENIIGTSEDDHLTGDDGSNVIEGGDGSDMLFGGGNTSGPGDTVSYRSSDRGVRVDLSGTQEASRGHAGGDEISQFENATGSAHDDDLTAVTGEHNTVGSTLKGLDGEDTLEGGLGNDTLEGGAGADELNGGYTFDQGTVTSDHSENDQKNTLSYAGSDAGVTVNLATASASGGHAEGDEIETYEFLDTRGTSSNDDDEEVDIATFTNVTGSDHNDQLSGDRFGNILDGGKGDDNLRGGAGRDELIGGAGADRMDGGSSAHDHDNDPATDEIPHEDWAVYRDAGSGVVVNMATGRGEADARGTDNDATGDTLKNIELVWGSKDYSDTFIAGAGKDIFHGDNNDKDKAGDTVSYEESKAGVYVNLAAHNNDAGYAGGGANMHDAWAVSVRPDGVGNVTTATTPDVKDDTEKTYGRAGNDDFKQEGYAFGDVLGGIENLTGSDWDDLLVGDGESNTLKGGDGDDILEGAGEVDRLHGGDGDDELDGGAGNDIINGGADNDIIDGGADNDIINGGIGDDDLTGGAGNDHFVFAPGDGDDIISDFTAGDKVNLTAFDLDLSEAEKLALIDVRGDDVILDLEDHGGGKITLQAGDTASVEAILDALGAEENSSGQIIKDSDGSGPNIGDYHETTNLDGVFIF